MKAPNQQKEIMTMKDVPAWTLYCVAFIVIATGALFLGSYLVGANFARVLDFSSKFILALAIVFAFAQVIRKNTEKAN